MSGAAARLRRARFPCLQPITEEPDSAGGKRRQTLASKLLGRKSSRVSSARADGGLEELKFGSVAAAVPVLQR